MLSGVAVGCGLVLGALVPRLRQTALTLLAIALALAGLVALAILRPITVEQGIAAFAGGMLGAVLLARAAPRVFVFVLLAAAALATVPLQPMQGLPVRIAALAGLAAVCGFLAFKVEIGMRVACALLGARIALAPFSPPEPRLAHLGLALVLFGVAMLLRPEEVRLARWRFIVPAALLAGALSGAGVRLAFDKAREVPVRPEPYAARLARIKALAPEGGLIWPLPSEAIAWTDDERGEFPWLPNHDALWLGADARGLWRLPGTTLRGRLALTRDIVKQRMVKDAAELKLLRAAAQASVKAVREVMPLLVPGAREADIAEAIRAAHKRAGCSGESFPPIVAAGADAAEPHGTGNRGVLHEGDLVMLDVGCLFGNYASDYTRTLPVSGRFAPEQRVRYEAVWAGQQAALRHCGPGARAPDRRDPTSLDAIAHRTIQEKGFDDHNPFGVGHPVGLFVHDLALPGPLQPGMVVTIEPGLYEKGRLGIRIEDTYLVTDSGCEQLTAGMPADADSIEAAMRASVAATAAGRSTAR